MKKEKIFDWVFKCVLVLLLLLLSYKLGVLEEELIKIKRDTNYMIYVAEDISKNTETVEEINYCKLCDIFDGDCNPFECL